MMTCKITQATRATRNSPTFVTLPIEILSQIISYIAKPAALSLARVSRHFTPFCDEALWRELSLWLSDHWGRRPLITPYAWEENRVAYNDWEDVEDEEVDENYGCALKDKMRVILLRADQRRIGMVKSVTMTSRKGAADTQLQILDLASPTVQTLHIISPPRRRPSYLQTLDIRLAGSDLTLPHLTSLRIGGHLRFIGLLVHIVQRAPNLKSLVADCTYIDDDDEEELDLPALQRDTRLEGLHVLVNKPYGVDSDDLREILAILRRSPRLRDLSLYTDEEPDCYNLFSALDGHVDLALQRLYLNVTLCWLDRAQPAAAVRGNVRCLVLQNWHWWHMFRYLPEADQLEAIYLDTTAEFPAPRQSPKPAPASTFTEPVIAQAMMPYFAERLRCCARLEAIHTAGGLVGGSGEVFEGIDEAEAKGDFTGVIRSFRRNNHELLHARFLLQYTEASDVVIDGVEDGSDDEDETEFSYTAHDGTHRLKTFKKLPYGVWQDFTDFEGMRVPLGVIARMRRVEGAKEEDWVSRGIEVGEAAWKVLEDWRDGVLKGLEAEE